MSRMHFVDQIATKKAGNIPGWVAFAYECVGSDTIQVKGGVPRILARGPNKGKKRWDGGNQLEFVTDEEVSKARDEYEAETGLCSECLGTGVVQSGWSCDKGPIYRKCRVCAGNGATP